MIDDALKLTIDNIFETKYTSDIDGKGDRKDLKSPFPVIGYSDKENLWYFLKFFKFFLNFS